MSLQDTYGPDPPSVAGIAQPPSDQNAPGGGPPQADQEQGQQPRFEQTRGQVQPPNPGMALMSLLGLNNRFGAFSGDPSGVNFNSPFYGDGDYAGNDENQTNPPPGATYNMPRQMFLPASANRPPGQWGRDWWPITAAAQYPGVSPGPYMPSPMEAYGVMGGAGRQMAMWGSPAVAGPAGIASGLAMQFAPLLDMVSKGQFSRNFNAARLQNMRLQQEQMLMNAEMASQRHKQEMLAYGSVFEEYRLGAIDHEEAKRRIRDLAIYDPKVTEMLNTRDLYGVEQFLTWQDAKMRDLDASTSTLRKTLGNSSEENAEYGYGSGGDQAGGGGLRELPGAPKVAGADNALTASTAEPLQNKDVQATDAEVMKATGATKQVMQAAHANLVGEENPFGPVDKKNAFLQNKIGQATAALNERAKQALRGPGNAQDKLAALEKIDPDLASKLRGLVEYQTDPNAIPVRANARERMLAMALQVDPAFNQSKYKAASEFWQVNKPENKSVARVASAVNAYHNLLVAAQRVPGGEDTNEYGNMLRRWKQGKLGGDDPWAQLFAAERVFADEMLAVASGGGQARVTLVMNLLKHLDTDTTMRQMRSQLQPDMSAAYGFVHDYQQQWERLTGKKTLLPGMDAETYRTYMGILRSNPHNGQMPDDPGLAKWSALNPTTKAKIDPRDDWKPLTREQYLSLTDDKIRALHDYVLANSASSDPAVRQRVLAAEQTLRAAQLAQDDPMLDLESSEQERTRNMPNAPRR